MRRLLASFAALVLLLSVAGIRAFAQQAPSTGFGAGIPTYGQPGSTIPVPSSTPMAPELSP